MHFHRKAIAFLTLIFFSFQTLAQGQIVVPGGNFSKPAELPEPISELSIPKELGEIETIYQAPAPRGRLIYLQDAHGAYDAQRSIQGLLGYLSQEKGIRTFFLEGAAERLNPETFHFFKDKRLNVKVADHLMRHGEWTGAEMFLLSAEQKVEAFGVEKAELYREDLQLFRDLLKKAEDVRLSTQAVLSSLDAARTRFFSKELRKFDQAWSVFHEQGELKPFLAVLREQARKQLGLDPGQPEAQTDYGALLRVFKMQDLEKRLDPSRIRKEKEALISFLRGKADRELIDRLARLEQGAVIENPRFLFEEIHRQAKDKGLDLRQYPHFVLYAEYLIFQVEIGSANLFSEIETLTAEIFHKLARTQQEKKLLRLTRDFELLRRFFTAEISRKEWEKIQKRKALLFPEVFEKRMRAFAGGEYSVPAQEWQLLFQKAEQFYRLAEEREESFLSLALQQMSLGKTDQAVFVAGGFHGPGLERLFRQNGFSFVSIKPRMGKTVSRRQDYLDAMLGKTDLSSETAEIVKALRLVSDESHERLLGTRDDGIVQQAVARVLREEAGFEPARISELWNRIARGEREIPLKAASLGAQEQDILREMEDRYLPELIKSVEAGQPFALKGAGILLSFLEPKKKEELLSILLDKSLAFYLSASKGESVYSDVFRSLGWVSQILPENEPLLREAIEKALWGAAYLGMPESLYGLALFYPAAGTPKKKKKILDFLLEHALRHGENAKSWFAFMGLGQVGRYLGEAGDNGTRDQIYGKLSSSNTGIIPYALALLAPGFSEGSLEVEAIRQRIVDGLSASGKGRYVAAGSFLGAFPSEGSIRAVEPFFREALRRGDENSFLGAGYAFSVFPEDLQKEIYGILKKKFEEGSDRAAFALMEIFRQLKSASGEGHSADLRSSESEMIIQKARQLEAFSSEITAQMPWVRQSEKTFDLETISFLSQRVRWLNPSAAGEIPLAQEKVLKLILQNPLLLRGLRESLFGERKLSIGWIPRGEPTVVRANSETARFLAEEGVEGEVPLEDGFVLLLPLQEFSPNGLEEALIRAAWEMVLIQRERMSDLGFEALERSFAKQASFLKIFINDWILRFQLENGFSEEAGRFLDFLAGKHALHALEGKKRGVTPEKLAVLYAFDFLEGTRSFLKRGGSEGEEFLARLDAVYDFAGLDKETRLKIQNAFQQEPFVRKMETFNGIKQQDFLDLVTEFARLLHAITAGEQGSRHLPAVSESLSQWEDVRTFVEKRAGLFFSDEQVEKLGSLFDELLGKTPTAAKAVPRKTEWNFFDDWFALDPAFSGYGKEISSGAMTSVTKILRGGKKTGKKWVREKIEGISFHFDPSLPKSLRRLVSESGLVKTYGEGLKGPIYFLAFDKGPSAVARVGNIILLNRDALQKIAGSAPALKNFFLAYFIRTAFRSYLMEEKKQKYSFWGWAPEDLRQARYGVTPEEITGLLPVLFSAQAGISRADEKERMLFLYGKGRETFFRQNFEEKFLVPALRKGFTTVIVKFSQDNDFEMAKVRLVLGRAEGVESEELTLTRQEAERLFRSLTEGAPAGEKRRKLLSLRVNSAGSISPLGNESEAAVRLGRLVQKWAGWKEEENVEQKIVGLTMRIEKDPESLTGAKLMFKVTEQPEWWFEKGARSGARSQVSYEDLWSWFVGFRPFWKPKNGRSFWELRSFLRVQEEEGKLREDHAEEILAWFRDLAEGPEGGDAAESIANGIKGQFSFESIFREYLNSFVPSQKGQSLGAEAPTIKILLADKPASENTIQAIRELAESYGFRAELLASVGIGKDENELRKVIETEKPALVIVRSDTKAFQKPDFLRFAKENGMKAVIRAGAGVDNINKEAARTEKISVIRTHGNANSVVNLALRYLLAALGGVSEAASDADVSRDETWGKIFDVPMEDFRKAETKSVKAGRGETVPAQKEKIYKELSPEQAARLFSKLEGKTLGLVGFGTIPQLFAAKLAEIKKITGVSFSVAATSPGLDRGEKEKVGLADRLGILHPGEQEVLRMSHVLSLHLPGEAKNYLTAEKMRSASSLEILLNTARQEVVASDYWQSALQEGGKLPFIYLADVDLIVKGKPVDEIERLRAAFPEIFYVTPHIAASTENAGAGVEQNTLSALKTALDILLGEETGSSFPLDIVNGVPLEPVAQASSLGKKELARIGRELIHYARAMGVDSHFIDNRLEKLKPKVSEMFAELESYLITREVKESGGVQLFEGAVEFSKYVEQHLKIPLYVMTGILRQDLSDRIRDNPVMDSVIRSEGHVWGASDGKDHSYPKDKQRGMEMLTHKYGRGRVLSIGDGLAEANAAKKTGNPFVWINRNLGKPMESLSDLDIVMSEIAEQTIADFRDWKTWIKQFVKGGRLKAVVVDWDGTMSDSAIIAEQVQANLVYAIYKGMKNKTLPDKLLSPEELSKISIARDAYHIVVATNGYSAKMRFEKWFTPLLDKYLAKPYAASLGTNTPRELLDSYAKQKKEELEIFNKLNRLAVSTPYYKRFFIESISGLIRGLREAQQKAGFLSNYALEGASLRFQRWDGWKLSQKELGTIGVIQNLVTQRIAARDRELLLTTLRGMSKEEIKKKLGASKKNPVTYKDFLLTEISILAEVVLERIPWQQVNLRARLEQFSRDAHLWPSFEGDHPLEAITAYSRMAEALSQQTGIGHLARADLAVVAEKLKDLAAELSAQSGASSLGAGLPAFREEIQVGDKTPVLFAYHLIRRAAPEVLEAIDVPLAIGKVPVKKTGLIADASGAQPSVPESAFEFHLDQENAALSRATLLLREDQFDDPAKVLFAFARELAGGNYFPVLQKGLPSPILSPEDAERRSQETIRLLRKVLDHPDINLPLTAPGIADRLEKKIQSEERGQGKTQPLLRTRGKEEDHPVKQTAVFDGETIRKIAEEEMRGLKNRTVVEQIASEIAGRKDWSSEKELMEFIRRRYNELTRKEASSLGEETLAYLRKNGRSAEAVSFIALSHARGGITEGIFYFPGNRAALLDFVEQRAFRRRAFHLSATRAAKNFNQDGGLRRFRDHLGIGHERSGDPVPFILLDGILQDLSQKPEEAARQVAASFEMKDLVVAAWSGADQPAFIENLRRILNKPEYREKKIQVRVRPDKVLSAEELLSLTRTFQAAPISVGTLQDRRDLETLFTTGSKVRLNKKLLLRSGIRPAQVLALLRQLADYPPERRAELFRKAGLDLKDGFWEVGAGFAALVETLYAERAAETAIRKAA